MHHGSAWPDSTRSGWSRGYEVRLKPDATRFGWRRTPRIPTNSELHGSR